MTSLFSRISAMAISAVLMLFASPTIINSNSKAPVSLSAAQTLQSTNQNQNTVVEIVVAVKDDRPEKLQKFLLAKGSPMAADAAALVQIADKYDLDWTFLPSIAGLESGYGKFVPTGSFNPYGWNNGRMNFKSWVDASETVAAGIRSRYQTSGEVTAWAIGSRYAESPTWAVRVVRNQQLLLDY